MSISRCRSMHEAGLQHGINIVTKLWITQWQDIIITVEREMEGPVSFFFVFLEKFLHEVCFLQIRNEDSENRSRVDTHKNADCLLKNTPPNITHMLSIKNSNILINVCFWVFIRIRVFLFWYYKIRFFQFFYEAKWVLILLIYLLT